MQSKGRKTFLSRLIKVLLAIFIGFFGMILILFVYFSYNKNSISEEILKSVNQKIRGEISFSKISFSPLVDFPDIAITLHQLNLFEEKMSEHSEEAAPVFAVEKLLIFFDLLNIFDEEIEIYRIDLINGQIDLVRYADSSYNFIRAFEAGDSLVTDSLDPAENSEAMSLNLKRIILRDILLLSRDQVSGSEDKIRIKSLRASLKINPKIIDATINAHILANSITLFGNAKLSERTLKLKGDFSFDKASRQLEIESGSLGIDKSNFQLEGKLNVGAAPEIDISISGVDDDLSFARLFISDFAAKHVTAGKAYFKGTIKGPLNGGIPQINVDFNTRDLSIEPDESPAYIRNLDLTGSFRSGRAEDMSQAVFLIDTLTATLPDGWVDASVRIHNFAHPTIGYALHIQVELDGFSKLLNLPSLKNLRGKLNLNSSDEIAFTEDREWHTDEDASAQLQLSDASAEIVNVGSIDKLNLSLLRQGDTLIVSEFNLLSGNTDINLSGRIRNFYALVLPDYGDASAVFNIRSENFDLPEFLSFDSNIGELFPYSIKDIGGTLTVETNLQKLSTFRRTPEILFKFNHLTATIGKNLPPVELESGTFWLGERDSLIYLDFKDFNAQIASSVLELDYQLFIPPSAPAYMWVGAKSDGSNLYSILVPGMIDSLPQILNNPLALDLQCEIILSEDSTVLFDEFNVFVHQIRSATPEFIFSLTQLSLHNSNLTWDTNSSTNFLASLRSESLMTLGGFTLNSISLENLNVKASLKDGNLKGFRSTIGNFTNLEGDSLKVANFSIVADSVVFDFAHPIHPYSPYQGKVKFEIGKLDHGILKLSDVDVDLVVRDWKYQLRLPWEKFFGKSGVGYLQGDLLAEPPTFRLTEDVDNFIVETLLSNLYYPYPVKGEASLGVSLNASGNNWEEILNSLSGYFILDGKNLTLKGIDLDGYIDNFKRTQSFSLVDIGAVLLAGPAGIAVTKGSEYANIAIAKKGDSTIISRFYSKWDIQNGKITFTDVGIATLNNRVATSGWNDLKSSELDLTLSLLDSKGCSMINQRFYGKADDPEKSRIKIVKTILAPVAHLLQGVGLTNCKVVYEGVVPHPKKK